MVTSPKRYPTAKDGRMHFQSKYGFSAMYVRPRNKSESINYLILSRLIGIIMLLIKHQ